MSIYKVIIFLLSEYNIFYRERGRQMKYLHIRIMELLKENEISKTKICKELDLQRGNFNRYCRDEFQRIDAGLILKLCDYFNCSVSDLLEIKEK